MSIILEQIKKGATATLMLRLANLEIDNGTSSLADFRDVLTSGLTVNLKSYSASVNGHYKERVIDIEESLAYLEADKQLTYNGVTISGINI